MNDTINTLATTPPPAHKLWRFKTSRLAQAETNRLENLLGLPPSPLNFNLTAANARIRDLEAVLAAKNAAASAVTLPAVLPKAASIAPATESPSLETLRGLCAHLFGNNSLPKAKQSEGEQRAVIENRLRYAHVKVSGLDQSHHIERTGLDRAVAARLQAMADKFLVGKN